MVLGGFHRQHLSVWVLFVLLMTDDTGQLPRLTPYAPSTIAGQSPPATFKARVQGSGRVSIPKSERDALDIDAGDIVQTIVVPTTTDHP